MSCSNKKTGNKKFKSKQTSSKCSVLDTAKKEDSSPSGQMSGQHQELEVYQRQAFLFMKTLKSDYKRLALIYNCCINSEQERERRNKKEIQSLKKIYHQMQNEQINIKRKNWCRYCESEATYLNFDKKKFYCSQKCEEKHSEFIGAIENMPKS